MFDGQMEMSFGQIGRLGSFRKRKQSRAQWWFQRMRQIVDRATDWQSAPPPRPVQIWFEATENRINVKIGPQAPADRSNQTDERQICE
jgi:hypothetical protein